MTSHLQAVCALTRDCGKTKHVCSAPCRSQDREAGVSACGEKADDAWLGDVVKGESQVTELLEFVNLVSSDIKIALSRSSRSKRNVDHRKYLQRQLSRLTSVPSDSFVLQNIETPDNTGEPDLHKCKDNEYAMFNAVTSYEDIQLKSKGHQTSWGQSKMLHDSRDVKGTELSSKTRDICLGISRYVKPENYKDRLINKKDNFNSTDGHFQRHSLKLKQLCSSANCYQSASLYPGESVQKQEVPLRQRQLPASFWQEPNVPTNVPRFQFDSSCFHGLCFGLYEQTQSYKAFLERLHTAQRQRLEGFGSQFPITDFLYQKYGVKDHLNSYPSSDLLLPQNRFHTDLKTISAYPGSVAIHPYAENRFSNTSSDLPTRSWDFVLGKWTTGYDSIYPPVWKPVSTQTLALNRHRFHPFQETR